MPNKLPDETINALLADLRRGEFGTYKELADRHGVYAGTVRKLRRKYGIPKKPFPSETARLLVADLRRGEFESYEELAEKHGVTKKTVERYSRKYGTPKKTDPRGPRSQTMEIVRQLETTDETMAEIAGRFDLSEQRIHQIKNHHNVTRPKDRRKEKQRKQIAAFLEESDLSIAEIAERTKAPPYSVKQVKDEIGIEKNAGMGGAYVVCVSCLRRRHPRLFNDSDTCSECQKPLGGRSELVQRLDELSRRPKMANNTIIGKRLENARNFHII